MICICIVHKNCIICHFYPSRHNKEKCVEFSFFIIFFLFCSLVRNDVTSDKDFFKFSTAKTTKQNKKYV